MYVWMPVVAAILFVRSSECERCNGIDIPKPTREGIPVVMDNAAATNFSFVARSLKEFHLWWNAGCESWNQGDVVAFTFVQTTRQGSENRVIHKNFTSCSSSEMLEWESTSFVRLKIRFRNATSHLYCYPVSLRTIVLPAPEIEENDNADPTKMSFRARTGFSPIAKCVLKYKEDQSVDSDWQEVTCSGEECNVESLKPARNYSVKIACGTLTMPPVSWSDPKVYATPMTAPSGQVRGVIVKNSEDIGYRRSVIVSWQTILEDHQNGEILFYTISVRGTTCDTPVKTYNTSMLSYIIHDLYYRCDYRISISASNLAGESSPRVTSLYRLNKPPSEAREFTVISISSESIEISWKDPEKPYGDINYTLSVHRKNSEMLEESVPVEIASIPGSETGEVKHYTITGLAPFTTYHLNLVAKNYFSTSDGINRDVTTSESVPSEGPVGLTLKHVHKQVTNLSVTWGLLPQDQRNGVIRSYTIYWWLPYSATCQSAPPVTALNKTVTGVSHIITDLKEGTSYCVTVAASTSVGEGPTAEAQIITTKRAAVTVSDIKTNATSDSISLVWNFPEDVNSTLLQLQIYHNEATASFQLGPQVCSKDHHTLRNLKPYTNYSISVQACWDSVSLDSCGDNKTVYARTISTFPSEPTDLMTRQLAQDFVNLTWHPPRQPNGPISHYQVTFYQDAQTEKEEKWTESLSMSLTIPCSSIGTRRIFVFQVAAVVDGLKGPAAKRNTTMCVDVSRVSDFIIALIGIPGFLISALLSMACCCALAPRRKLEIKHAKAIFEPKMVSSCAKVPEKEKFDMLKCQSATKLETDTETYVVMHPKKFTALKTSTSNQSYIQMSRGAGYLPDMT
ncbi:Phosphatidylinositol phosphatase PTPRQ [Holothuria leucospilota]|uniref:Phosphatidylinositol phosphatase PTPRQ n=1 Tax=Holothuria leucospilota TaxID=206669 RepID=A0A9Q1C8R3_HOLLE|nr:Phosphatidylinositol phosphatase PTPRQ [Holothuria leucospilota]